MTRYSIPAVFCAVIMSMTFCGTVHADIYEFHGGVYTSYEYTDNYLGTSHDEQSDNIYEIGPSASFLWDRQTTQLSLSGHAARSYHREFDEDDSTNVYLDSLFTASTSKDSLRIGYGFTKTNRRETLSEVSGDSRRQRGSLAYSRTLTPAATIGLDYSYYAENYRYPNDDIVSHSITGTVSDRILENTTVRVNGGYDLHYYKNGGFDPGETPRGDTWIARSGLGLDQQVSSRSTLSIDGSYNHQGRIDLPDVDTSSVSMTWAYILTSYMSMSLSGGYSWLKMEDIDREGSYTTSGELTARTQYDTLSLRVSKAYVAEFTEDRYGTYDSRSVYISWRRDLLRELNLLTVIDFDQRKLVSTSDDSSDTGDEKDFTGNISMNWTPIEHLTITTSYRKLQRILEIADPAVTGHTITDTERENRYMIRVEVLY